MARTIENWTLKDDPATGLQLVRIDGRWMPAIVSFSGRGDCLAQVYSAGGGKVDLPISADGWLRLPNGKRTRRWYH